MTSKNTDDDLVLPLIQERAVVHKDIVETGRVTVTTRVEERRETVREALRHEDVSVERVSINRPVDVAPPIRQVGDVLIYPIVEEELVVTKRLVLREELHITRKARTETIERDITLRSVQADVHRTTAAPDFPDPSSPPV